MALFTTHDNQAAYFCAKCFAERIEEALHDMPPEAIAETVLFTNCGHVEDGTGSCGRCVKAMMAFLVFTSMREKLKPKESRLTHRLDHLVQLLVTKYGRISCHGVYTRDHGKAIR